MKFVKTGLSFSEALEALKNGDFVSREGWNGKEMFLYKVTGSDVPFSNLRGEARDAARLACRLARSSLNDETKFHINSHIDMKAADGTLVIGWLASQTDLIAHDWCILDTSEQPSFFD